MQIQGLFDIIQSVVMNFIKVKMVSCVMKIDKKITGTVWEFLRYCVVGGIAFVVDTGVLVFFREIVFNKNESPVVMAKSVAAGFIAGLIVNYILSMLVVFRTPGQQKKGKTVKAFVIFTVVGLVGLGLTELLMYIGVKIVGSAGLWYILVKCFVTAVVMVWNYVGRKIFVFKGE